MIKIVLYATSFIRLSTIQTLLPSGSLYIPDNKFLKLLKKQLLNKLYNTKVNHCRYTIEPMVKR